MSSIGRPPHPLFHPLFQAVFRLWAVLLPLLLASPIAAQDPAIAAERTASDGAGTLYRYASGDTVHRVLVLRGAPRAMGLAHGRLLRDEVRASVQAFLYDWALKRMGRSREELVSIWERISRHVPACYREELAGLAEGAGVPLEDLQLVHAIPSRFHCTGAAALPAVTADGKVYHTRSLDYALDIGDTVRPQTNALLLVSVPDEGLPHAVVTWSGFLGCVTGMNGQGLAVGEMGSRSSDETFDGFPMVFLLRETLRTARNVKEAKELWRTAPRTCGYNFIFSDPGTATAVECNRSRIAFFDAGDPAEDVAPHAAIPGIVRRCNHFVDPVLAGTQRELYDPRTSAGSSWGAYWQQGEMLRGVRGRIDAETMVALLRSYPASHPCLHQAVMCPSDAAIWVSQATDPAADPLPGAQNQPFFRYELRPFFEGAPPAPALRSGTDRSVRGEAESGLVEGERAIEGVFAHEPASFPFRMEPLRALGPTRIYHLTYPSPGPSAHPQNLTVHAEYYRPKGEGPFPSAVVLDILDGRGYVARLLATTLAARGVAALYVTLPYYGERRPPAADLDLDAIDLPDVAGAMKQAVRDVRRGAAWLRSRPEVDRAKVGIVGVSLGAFVAEMAAGADGGFDRCCFVLGGGSVTEAVFSGGKDTRKVAARLEARGWTKAKVAALFAPLEPAAHATAIAKDGVLMINCRADDVVPPASTRAYWEALGKPEILWYDGGHYGIKDHVFEVLARIGTHFVR